MRNINGAVLRSRTGLFSSPPPSTPLSRKGCVVDDQTKDRGKQQRTPPPLASSGCCYRVTALWWVFVSCVQVLLAMCGLRVLPASLRFHALQHRLPSSSSEEQAHRSDRQPLKWHVEIGSRCRSCLSFSK